MSDNCLSKNPIGKYTAIGLFCILLFLGLTVAIHQITRNNTLGTDFFIYYAAGQNITIHHTSPYDESVGERSQMAILKHPARENEDQLRFVYPPYGLIPILPLTFLSFPWAQAAWMAFNLLFITSVLLLGFRNVSPWIPPSIFLIFPFFFSLLLGNLNLPIIGILFLVAARFIQSAKPGRLEYCLLGVLMAWTTIKPQFTAFYILFFLIFGLKEKNQYFLTGFFAGFASLVLVSFAMLPNWVTQWLYLIKLYPGYTGTKIFITPLISGLFPSSQTFAYILLLVLAGGLLGWSLIKWWKNRITSLKVMVIGGFVVFLFHPTGVSYEQMIFLFPFLLWIIQVWHQKPVVGRIALFVTILCSLMFVFLSMSRIWPAATYYGQYFLYIIWMLTVFRMVPGNLPEKSLSKIITS